MEGRKWMVHTFDDLSSMACEVAGRILKEARDAIHRKGRISLVLSGGRTPGALYSILVREYPEGLWPRTLLFWGDERCVPPDHRDSNFGLAYRELISKVPIPDGNIHRIEGELPAEMAARRYEDVVRRYLADPMDRDLLLLGMGRDGHVASIFPGSPALWERERWVIPATAPRGDPVRERVTLTLPFINTFNRIYLLIAGKEKDEVVKAVLEDPGGTARYYPVAMVEAAGSTHLFIDSSTVKF